MSRCSRNFTPFVSAVLDCVECIVLSRPMLSVFLLLLKKLYVARTRIQCQNSCSDAEVYREYRAYTGGDAEHVARQLAGADRVWGMTCVFVCGYSNVI